MTRSNDILSSGEMLSEHFAIILILFTFLGDILGIYSHYLWLLLIIDLVKLDLLEDDFSIIIFSLEARDEAISVGLKGSHQHYVNKGQEDNRNRGK